MKELIEKYIEGLKPNFSDNTVRSYGRDLFLFNKFYESSGLCEEEAVKLYIKDAERTKSSSSVLRLRSSLNGFYKFLISKGLRTSNPVESIAVENSGEKKYSHIKSEDIKHILNSPKGYGARSVRNRAILYVMYETGYKSSAVLNIEMDKVEELEKKLSPAAAEVLEDYIYGSRNEFFPEGKKEKDKDPGYLFLNCDGKKMSRQGLWKIIKQYMD